MTTFNKTPKHGLLMGCFEPLTQQHLIDINYACQLVEMLHIVVLQAPNDTQPSDSSPNPKIHPTPTLFDKARWLQVSTQQFGFIQIHTPISLSLDDQLDSQLSYDLPDFEPTILIKHTTSINRIAQQLQLDADELAVLYYSSTPFDDASFRTKHTYCLPFCVMPLDSPTAHQAIDPIQHFDKIAQAARYFYTKTVCIIGGESSGKTTLVHKLANHYNASVALEMGRLYIHSHLGGTEIGLQYSDYQAIAINHAHAILQAKQNATAAITVVDTDFVTTQAFCQEYEHQSDPIVASFIDHFKMDYTIMLANNVQWVADGMRRLGTPSDRLRFENHLIDIACRHNIKLHLINDQSYHERYLKAVAFIDQHIFGQ